MGLINETGHRYGKLTVINSIRRPQDKTTMWLCQCDCGNTIICRGCDLRAGKRTSCGKRCNNIVEEKPGTMYGYLEVLSKDPAPGSSFPDKSTHWICKCHNCGTIKSVSGRALRRGDAKSCGCIKSLGETLIKEILNELNYNFKQEYTFDDLISPFSKLKLRFDFGVLDNNNNLLFLIEYNGSQHEREVKYFGNKLEKIQACDEKKRLYCLNKGIPLITFTHINERLPDKESVKESIQEFKGELEYGISN